LGLIELSPVWGSALITWGLCQMGINSAVMASFVKCPDFFPSLLGANRDDG
jgi:hypothetical protein